MQVTWLTIFGGEIKEPSREKGGVAAYSVEVVRALRARGIEVDVLAEKTGAARGDQPWVSRAWRQNSLVSIWRAVRARRPRLLHAQHEVFLYGGIASAIGLPVVLSIVRASGIHVVLTLHGVVDLDDIDENFCERNRIRLPVPIVRASFRVLFRCLTLIACRSVVHAEVFRERLVRQYGSDPRKIDVVPHVVPESNRVEPERARAALGIPGDTETLLFFGFVTAYKGMDELLDAFDVLRSRGRNVHLVVAGAPHPKRVGDRKYELRYEAWRRRATATTRCTWLGFVDGADVNALLSAADVMVLPYRELISMSGPLSAAAAQDLRVVCSSVMRCIVEEDVPTAELAAEPFADAIERALDGSPPPSFALWRGSRSAKAIAARHEELYRRVGAS